MRTMNILDLIIFIVLLLGAIRGFQKGFFHEIAILAGLVVGVLLAVLGSNMFGGRIASQFDWNEQVVNIVVFVLIFIAVLFVIRLAGALLTRLFKVLMLGFVNRIAGLGIGALKWALILAILFMLIDFFDPEGRLLSDNLQSGSFLYPRLQLLYERIIDAIGSKTLPEVFAT